MSMRIQNTPLSIPRPGVEQQQKPGSLPPPPPSVQGPTAATLAQALHGSSFKTREQVLDLQGGAKGPGADSVQRQLSVNSAYSRLMEDPVTAKGLNALRVRDGAALAALGNLLTSGKLPLWPEKQASLDKLRQGQPALFDQLITLAQQLGTNAPAPASSAPSLGATQAAGALTAAQGAYAQAKGAALGLDQQLSRELDSFGPALSGAQRQAYVEAFHGAHQAEYDQASQAEAALAATLTNPELDALAAQDLNVAYATAQAAETLAGGSHSVEVLQWAARIMGDSNAAQDMFEQTQTGVSMPGWAGAGAAEVRPPVDFDALRTEALTGAAGQLLAEANGDPQEALNRFSAMASALGGDTAKTNEMLTALQKASAGDFSELSRMVQSPDPIVQGLGTAATMFAGLQAKTAPQQAAYGQFLKDTVAAGRPQVVGRALRGLANASTSAPQGSPVNTQMTASLGALTSALGTGEERQELFNESSFEDNAQMLTDLSGLAGNGATAAAETLTDSVTDLITDLGDQLFDAAQDDSVANDRHTERQQETGAQEKRQEEAEQLLEKAGVARNLSKALARSADMPKALRSKVGLTPALITSLANSFPDLFSGARAAQEAVEFAKTSGVKGEGVQKFFEAMKSDDADFLQTMETHGEALRTGDAESRALAARLFPKATELARQTERDRFTA